MDSDEDEAPPLLVDIETQSDEVEEKPNIRVPITIVTGKSSLCQYELALTSRRVPWGWKDDPNELYLDRATWKEDSCHIKW